MTKHEIKFGYLPEIIDITSGDISITSINDIQETIKNIEAHVCIENDWIYAPIYENKYSSRIFGLPQTHIIAHKNVDSLEHLDFLVWCLSFFKGIRLTTTSVGFLDATPIKTWKLVDFILVKKDQIINVMQIAENFWQSYSKTSLPKNIIAIIHALFVSHYPQSLQYEQFTHLYQALDGCYYVINKLKSREAKNHAQRIELMCNIYNIEIPNWAKIQNNKSQLANVRNYTFHEALFWGKPLGFSIYGGDNPYNGNIILEMQNLICRILVAIFTENMNSNPYVKTQINTRQKYGLCLNS